ncbi:MAG: vWA domain-containing protein, partial [Eubacterium sp.]
MIEKIMTLRKTVKRRLRIIVALASVVVFATTYALILPGITLDQNTMTQQSGVTQEAGAGASGSDRKAESKEISKADTDGAAGKEKTSESSESSKTAEHAAKTSDTKQKTGETDTAGQKKDTDQKEDSAQKQADSKADTDEDLITAETTLTYQTDDYTVTVSFDKAAQLPKGVKLKVHEITKASAKKDYEAYQAGALKTLQNKDSRVSRLKSARFYDISFEKDGKSVEPSADVSVSIRYRDAIQTYSEKNIQAVHFKDNGKKEVVSLRTEGTSARASAKVKEVRFDADSFSVYGIVDTEKITSGVITADGISATVEVSYKTDAGIPEGAELNVNEIRKDTKEYQNYLKQSEAALKKESGTDKAASASTGDAAEKKEESSQEDPKVSDAKFFDISILSDGKEIEPKAPVTVKITYADQVAMKTGQKMKAVHFASKGTEIIDIDKSSKGKDGGITSVTFRQDSFSVTGTVIQDLTGGWPEDGTYVMVLTNDNKNYYAVDSNGNLRNVNYDAGTGKVTFEQVTSEEQLSDYQWTVAGDQRGTYIRNKDGSAYIDPFASGGISKEGAYLNRDQQGRLYSYSYYNGYNYLGMNTSTQRLKLKGQNSARDSFTAKKIFFAESFRADNMDPAHPGAGDDTGGLSAPATEKTLSSNGDGTYNLSLSVTGASKASTSHTKADVIVVLDRSGSMQNSVSGSRRDVVAQQAVNSLAKTLLQNNTSAHPDTVQLSLVTFNNGAQTMVSGTSSLNTFQQAVNAAVGVYNTGTNWEEALKQANSVSTRSGAETYVIFVSDGNPTYYGTRPYGTGQETDQNILNSYNAAKDDARRIVAAGKHFYTLGVFGNVSRMQSLTGYAYSGSDSGTYPAGHYQTASDQSALNQAFANIIEDIQKNFTYTKVDITDGLTSMTASTVISGSADSFTYKITDKDGNDITSTELTKIPGRASYNSSTHSVEWKMGDYDLKDGATYTVSFTVWPSQEAYDLVADLNNGIKSYEGLTDAQKAQIAKKADGTYGLNTNTTAQVNYQTVKRETGKDPVYTDHDPAAMTNPDPMGLTASTLKLRKEWQDSSDPSQLLAILKENPDYKVTLNLKKNSKAYKSGITITPTVSRDSDGNPVSAVWPEKTIDIAPGLMVKQDTMKSYGLDTSKYTKVTYQGTVYYILEKGADYDITEQKEDYHFELDTETYHPMLVNGTLRNVVFTYGSDGSITGIKEIKDYTLTYLKASNRLKGSIALTKVVKDAVGNEIYPEKAEFTVHCVMKDKDGKAYTRDSQTVGSSESDGIVYRIVSRDGTKGERIGVTDSSGFDVKLKAGDTVEFLSLPTGTTWSFEETAGKIPEGYKQENFTNTTGTVEANTQYTSTLTNRQTAAHVNILKVSATDNTKLGGAT